jgi:hypothetical protein
MNTYRTYRENPMYRYLLLLVIASAIGFQGWRTLFNNYAVDVVGVNGFQIGVIQSVREIPGFLTFFVIYLLLVIKEHRFAALSIVMLGGGVFMAGIFPSFGGLVFTTVVMSVGFHFFETTNQSLSLQYFDHTRIPRVLASFKSYGALTNITVGAIIWVISRYLPMQDLFYLFGGILVLVGLFALTRDPVDKTKPPQQRKLILRKKYWLFYTLNFLAGARRQIFVVFAIFLLVEKYGFSVQHITILFVLNNIMTFFLSPQVAKAIHRFGERTMLTVEYASLLLVFLGYGLIEDKNVATAMYLVDNLFFSFSIAINTYFQKKADAKDIAPSMAVGFTINHIMAVIIPVFGGLLWMYNWRIPFIAGAGIALTSLIFAQFVKTPAAINKVTDG